MFFGPEVKWRDRAIVHTAELFYLLKPELPYPDWPLGDHKAKKSLISFLHYQHLAMKKNREKEKSFLDTFVTYGLRKFKCF